MIPYFAWGLILGLVLFGLVLFCRDEVYDLGWGDEADLWPDTELTDWKREELRRRNQGAA